MYLPHRLDHVRAWNLYSEDRSLEVLMCFQFRSTASICPKKQAILLARELAEEILLDPIGRNLHQTSANCGSTIKAVNIQEMVKAPPAFHSN